MTVAHPDSRLSRGLLEHVLIQPDGLFEFAETTQRRCFQIPVADRVRLGGENVVEELQRFAWTARSAKKHREIRLCSSPAGRKFDGATKQVLRVLVAPDARRQL